MPSWMGWPWRSNTVAPVQCETVDGADGCVEGRLRKASNLDDTDSRSRSRGSGGHAGQGGRVRRCAARPAWIELSPFEKELVQAMMRPTAAQVQDQIRSELLAVAAHPPARPPAAMRRKKRSRSARAASDAPSGMETRRSETPDMVVPWDATPVAKTPWGLATIQEEKEGELSRCNSWSSSSSDTSDYGFSEDHPDLVAWNKARL